MKRRDALSQMGSVLGLTSLGAAMTATGNPARGQSDTKESWDQVVAAGKKEGLVVWSFFGAPGASTERQAREFEQLYGIRVELAPARTGDFEARWNAERAAGKASIDIRSSGSPENRRLAARDLDQPFGTLPAAAEAGCALDHRPAGRCEGRQRPYLDDERGRLFHPGQQQALSAGGRPAQLQGPRRPEIQGPHRSIRAHWPFAGIALGGLCLEGLRRRSPAQGDRQREGADAGRDRGPQADCPRRVRHLHPSHPGGRRGHLEAAQAPPVPARGSRGRRDAPHRRNEPAEGRPSSERRPCVHELRRSPSPPSRSTPTTRADHSSARTSRPRFRSWRTSPRPSRFPATPTPTSSARSCSSNGQPKPSRT